MIVSISTADTLWIGAYSLEHTASCTANNANTSATADVSANTQVDSQAKRLPSLLNSLMLPLTFALPNSLLNPANGLPNTTPRLRVALKIVIVHFLDAGWIVRPLSLPDCAASVRIAKQQDSQKPPPLMRNL